MKRRKWVGVGGDEGWPLSPFHKAAVGGGVIRLTCCLVCEGVKMGAEFGWVRK